jgi:hypothetical protein
VIHEDKPSLDNALMHFGVKGMKWGQRRKSKIGLVENVKLNVQGQRDFNAKKKETLIKAAKSGDYKIEAAFKGDLSAKVLSGEEFISRLAKGKKLNVAMSDLDSHRVAPHPNDTGPVFVPTQFKLGNYKLKNYNKKS